VQLLAIADGEVPVSLEDSPHVLLRAAECQLQNGKVAQAESNSRHALDSAADHLVLRVFLTQVLVQSLWRTTFEDNVTDGGIHPKNRPATLEQIQAQTSALETKVLPAAVRESLLRVQGMFYALTLDATNLTRLERSQAFKTLQPSENDPRALAFKLASSGELEAALDLLAQDDHPWRPRLDKVDLLHARGDTATAKVLAIELANEFPGRSPIDYTAAKLLLISGDAEAALPLAQRAKRNLPGKGYLILLARCLLSMQEYAMVTAELAPLAEDTDLDVLGLLATAADNNEDPASMELWRRYIREAPNNGSARVRLASALARYGDIDEAARVAEIAIRRSGHSLTKNELFACGRLQLRSARDDNSEQLTREVASLLRTRFEDDEAEHYRLLLLSAIGLPIVDHPIDYERLVELGHLRSVSIDDVTAMVAQQRRLSAAAYEAYHQGWLSFESFCRLTGARAAEVVVQLSKAPHARDLRLRTPVAVGDPTAAPSLRGTTVLVSDLELLVLHQCDLLDQMVGQLGDTGHFVMFHDVWNRVMEDRLSLEAAADRGEARRVRALLTLIVSSGDFSMANQPDQLSDLEFAETAHILWIGHTPTDSGVGIVSVLKLLTQRRELVPETVEKAVRQLGVDDTTEELPIALPETAMLAPQLVDQLHRLGLLESLAGCFDRLVVGREALHQLRTRAREFERRLAAADLAEALHRRLGEGRRDEWLKIAARPAVDQLPRLREEVNTAADLVREPIHDALTYRQALLENTNWWRLTAEFVGTDGLGDITHLTKLAWPSPDAIREFLAQMRSVAGREVTIPQLVRGGMPSSEQSNYLLKLAKLGFQDALSARELLQLANTYGGLDVGIPDSILSKMEAAASSTTDHWADLVRLKLAAVYAEAMWQAFFADDAAPSIDAARAICATLLDRASSLDQNRGRLTEQILGNLVTLAIERPSVSFKAKEDDSDTFVPSAEAPVSALWNAISHWIAGRRLQESACRRAISHAWRVLDTYRKGGSSAAQWMPVILATDLLLASDENVHRVPHPDAVAAILSAFWKERPLSARRWTLTLGEKSVELDLEELLQHATELATTQPKQIAIDALNLHFEYPVGDKERRVSIAVPVEAVLLRADQVTCGKLAASLATLVGPRDGRLYRQLQQLVDSPGDESSRRAVARTACAAPFKLVYDFPALMLAWGVMGNDEVGSYPRSLAELSELLPLT